MTEYSKFGESLTGGSGIEELMHDLGHALAEGGDMAMLGGGNPAPIPPVQAIWRGLMRTMLTDEPERFDRMLGHYDPQQGNQHFVRAVADLFNKTYGWGIGPENVIVTNGGQTAYFLLFNLLAGEMDSGDVRKVLFPVSPDYIGYAEQGAHPEMFLSLPSRIEELPGRRFKYRVDFDALPEEGDIAAVCVSRPTNPTGNVLTDNEVRKLHAWARERDALLMIDNAYGTPFPNIIFADAEPFWDEGVILTYSLSKLGLPGTRTGIIIAPPEIVRAIGSMNAVIALANGNIGQALTQPLFESGEILSLCRDLVKPFYETRSARAVEIFQEAFRDLPLRIHVNEGALFLWLWFPELKIGSAELYRLFKEAGVLVVPGHYFFHSLREPWVHAEQCVRVNYAMDIDALPAAAEKMAAVVRVL